MESQESITYKEMTREEFLSHAGYGIASVFGVSSVLNFLINKNKVHKSPRFNVRLGVGLYGKRKASTLRSYT